MVLQIKSCRTDRGADFLRYAIALVALVGVVHFIGSLIAWGFFYVGSYRNRWSNVLTWAYGTFHLLPAMILFGAFAASLNAACRCRRYAVPVLLGAVLLSIAMFIFEIRGEPQLQRVWFDEPFACSNRKSFYCTWWWWQPTRHRSQI